MNTAYKQPGKIKISKEAKVDILDILDEMLVEISSHNYTDIKVSDVHPHLENMLDLNDLYREIQGADYLIEQLQKIKIERIKETDSLLKQINNKNEK